MATTFLQLYDSPPVGSPLVGAGGNTSTVAMNPGNYPAETALPRHIVDDPNLCQRLRAFAQNYLAQITRSPPAQLNALYTAVQVALTLPGVGDEGVNTAFFPETARYATMFAASADQVPLTTFRFRTCDMVEGIRPDMMFMRDQQPRMVVEYKGTNAFDHHRSEISNLARANGGQGTELIYSGYEVNGRSIVMKLGKYLIQKNCLFALVFGGDRFFLFYRHRFVQQNQVYYQLIISPCLEACSSPPMHNVVQLVIAVLLGHTPDVAVQHYSPPSTTIRTPYRQIPSSTDDRKLSAPTKQHAKGGIIELRRGRQVPKSYSADIPGIQDIQYCTVSWPLSVFPTRTVTLESVNMSTSTSNKRTSSSLRLYESLGGGIYGTVYEGLWIVGKQRLSCAVKTMEVDYQVFRNELDVYRHLHQNTFTLPLYAAFSGTHQSRQFGVLITDILERTFKSYNDMTDQEKMKALQCLRQLHEAGYRHGDVSPANFGVNNGDLVIIDFSNSTPCESRNHEDCSEVHLLKEMLFEDARA